MAWDTAVMGLITSIIFHVNTSGRYMVSKWWQLVGTSSTSNFMLADGVGTRLHFTESNHLAADTGAKSNGIGLYFLLHLAFCVVCPDHLQARTNSLLCLASAMHKFPAPERSVKTCQCNRFMLSSFGIFYVLVQDVRSSRFKPTSEKERYPLRCIFKNHILPTALMRRCLTDWGMSYGENLFLWLRLQNWWRMREPNETPNWKWLLLPMFFGIRSTCITLAASKVLHYEEKDKEYLIWGALRVLNTPSLSIWLCHKKYNQCAVGVWSLCLRIYSCSNNG